MKKKNIIIIFLSIILLGCGHKGTDKKVVCVTIEPQRYFAEQIAGDKYSVHSLVPAGQSPETYDPTPQQMIQLAQSSIYLRIGHIGFEQTWMERIKENNKDLKIFDLSKGIELIEEEPDHKHAHGTDEGHSHPGGIDPHTWSSISGAKTIAYNTLEAFIASDKANEAYYKQNYKKLMDKILETEKSVHQLLDTLSQRTFIIYHPALTYFAKEQGLTQLCIEMDGKEPSPAQIKELIKTAKESKARVVFIQQEFDQKNAELISKETGCRLVSINPLNYNWNEEMVRIAKTLSDGKIN